jgi:hypothetical protein
MTLVDCDKGPLRFVFANLLWTGRFSLNFR